MKKNITALSGLVFFLLLFALSSFAEQVKKEDKNTSETSGIQVIRAAVPADGLLAPPIFRMIEKQPLSRHGIKVEFVPWRNQDQLRALILSGSADIVGIHVPTAALFAKKGVPVKFLGVSLGDVLSVISTDEKIHSLNDLKQKTVAVPMRGEFPDILFRAAIEKSKLGKYIKIQYTATSLDSANMLTKGAVDAALVAEPHISILLEKMKSSGEQSRRIYRAFTMQEAWDQAWGKSMPLPTAGIAAFGEITKDKKTLELFWKEYLDAAGWCLENPESAMKQLGDPMASEAAIKGGTAAFSACAKIPVASSEDREAIETYLKAFGDAAPEPFGGLSPGDSFYWTFNPEKK